MREFKFRIWDKKTKKMRVINSISFNYENEYCNFNSDRLPKKVNCWGYDIIEQKHIICHREIKDIIIMQYVGLKDKNGKDIYEGDILDVCNGSINGREWKDEPYDIKYQLNKGFIMPMFCWDKNGNNIMDSTHWCEVIGNIYENKKLLKELKNEQYINGD